MFSSGNDLWQHEALPKTPLLVAQMCHNITNINNTLLSFKIHYQHYKKSLFMNACRWKEYWVLKNDKDDALAATPLVLDFDQSENSFCMMLTLRS
jgi:hypothetical protein